MSAGTVAVTEGVDAPWRAAEEELGYAAGAPRNVGWQCSDGACARGRARAPALVWEGARGLARSAQFIWTLQCKTTTNSLR